MTAQGAWVFLWGDKSVLELVYLLYLALSLSMIFSRVIFFFTAV